MTVILLGWAPLLVLPTGVILLAPLEWPRWLFMWLLAFAVFAGCNWLTWIAAPNSGVPRRRHVAYLFFWPGLDAKAFLSSRQTSTQDLPSPNEWNAAGFKLVAGATLFWSAGLLVPEGNEWLLGWLGMVGMVLMLHFGSFNLLSCAWRSYGVAARPLMDHPFTSVRVSEFWGQRWNTAFRDFAHRFLFRPLTKALGPKWGIVAGFAFSGVVHDVVISVPAGGGFGGPTCYFGIQAVALLFERSPWGRIIGLGTGVRGWLFTMLSVVAPAYWLFHPPFIHDVVVPFMNACDAGWPTHYH